MANVTIITGNIESGKSLVTQYLCKKGYAVVEADKVVHQFLDDPQYQDEIWTKLPNAPMQQEASALIPRIREAMFEDKAFKAWYLPWIHQKVYAELNKHIDQVDNQLEKRLFLEIPIYFETEQCVHSPHQLWLVWTPPALRIQRWKQRSRASYQAMKKIETWQIPDAQKFKKADMILINSVDDPFIHAQIESALSLQ